MMSILSATYWLLTDEVLLSIEDQKAPDTQYENGKMLFRMQSTTPCEKDI